MFFQDLITNPWISRAYSLTYYKLTLDMVSPNQQNSYMPMPNQPMGWWSSVDWDWPYRARLGWAKRPADPLVGGVLLVVTDHIQG